MQAQLRRVPGPLRGGRFDPASSRQQGSDRRHVLTRPGQPEQLPDRITERRVELEDALETLRRAVELVVEQPGEPECTAWFGVAEWRKGDDAESLVERAEAELAAAEPGASEG